MKLAFSRLNPNRAFYECYRHRIVENMSLWKSKFPNFKPYYAVKCNDHPFLLQTLASLGCNFDCASLNEIKLIRTLTKGKETPTIATLFDTYKKEKTKFQKGGQLEESSHSQYSDRESIEPYLPPIIFANPIKLPSDLRTAKKLGTTLMTADCPEELDKIAVNCPQANVILRIAVDDSQSVCKFNKKFGLMPWIAKESSLLKEDSSPNRPTPQLIDFFEKYRSLCLNKAGLNKKNGEFVPPPLSIVGVSFHVGSGCLSATSYFDAIKKSRFVFDFAKQYGIQMKILDIGGGFIQKEPLLTQVSQTLSTSLNQFFGKNNLPLLIGEPGRFMAANVYDLSVPLIGIKKDGDRYKYYIAGSVYGSFNSKLFDYATFSFDIHKKSGQIFSLHSDGVWRDQSGVAIEAETSLCTIFGATCDSLDVIIEDQRLPKLELGDRFRFHQMGAYTYSSSSEFNGIPLPTMTYI